MATTVTYTETELVSLLKGRDSKAFGYLYDHYSGALLTIIMQIVNDTELAHDVLQEVFVNVWKKVESYDPEKGRLFTWMLNIARNAAIDTVRSKAYRNQQKNQSISDAGELGAGRTVQLAVDNIGLKKVLEKLGDEQRVLIELAYFKGYTHEEIATLQDMPLGTVKTRIRNALIQLRTYLK